MSNKAVESRVKDDSKEELLFKPASWFTKIDFINHLIMFNNVLMAVLAEKGGGKSTFAKLLQTNLDASIKSYRMTVPVPFSSKELMVRIAENFNLRSSSSPNLEDLVTQINERKAHVLIILDDAQHIPDEFIHEALAQLKNQGTTGYFHLCLVSDYSIVSTLNKFNNDTFKNLIHSIEPGELSESETKTYILNYLPLDKRLEKSMTSKRIKTFYDMTGGEIARINQQLNQFFVAEANQSGKKSKAVIKSMSIAASLAALGLGGFYLWENQELLRNSLFPKVEATQESSIPKIARDVPQPRMAMASATVSDAGAILESKIPPFFVAAVSQPIQPPPLKKMFEFSQNDEEEFDDKLVVMDKVVVIPKTLPRKITHSNLAEHTPAHNVIKPETQRETVARDLPKKTIAYGKFTIQLLASRNKADVLRFIDSHKLKDKAILKKSMRNGQEWYVLTIGEYSDFEKAKIVMNQLPASVTQFKPWIRSVSSLKAIG